MALEISIVSTQIIKPTSPTPHHLRNHTLSILDQYVPPVPVSCILFYPALKDVVDYKPTSVLKSSLSDTLADFYPLAGRISDNKSIECNDEGVNFFETKAVGRKFDQVVNDAAREEMEKLLPEDRFYGLGPKVLLSVQFNRFDCGGMALGLRMSHKAIDASSLNLFLQNWAASARGDRKKIVHPKYDMSSLFPGKDNLSNLAFPPPKELDQKFVTKRFVLSASNIAALKARCAYQSGGKTPTRVQSVVALIWKSVINARRKTRAEVKPRSQATLAVNLRGKMTPRLSTQYCGNIVIPTMAISGTEDTELDSLVDKISTAITKVNSEFVRRLLVDEELQKSVVESFGQIQDFEVYRFTVWCRFSFYETDFGWGRPCWMSCAGRVVPNSGVLVDAEDGEGVEAWVTLNEPEMAAFEAEPDIITFASDTTN